MIGFQEILLIGLIVLLLFGASNIPKVARAIGEGIKELKKGLKDDEKKDENRDNIDKNH